MTRIALVGLLLSAPVLMAAAGPESEDHRNIQGTWQVEANRVQGKDEHFPEGLRFVISRSVLRIQKPGQSPQQQTVFSYALNPTKSPKEIDLVIQLGEGTRPVRQLAIYSLEGDALQIHSAVAGKPRPTTFENQPDDFGTHWTLKRVNLEAEAVRPPSDEPPQKPAKPVKPKPAEPQPLS